MNLTKFIFKMKVNKYIKPDKIDWLSDWDDDKYPEESFKYEQFELYFSSFEEMSEELNKLTIGYYQFWADVHYDMYENNVESLEYHNGSEKWDQELHIVTSRLYLSDSLLIAIDKIRR